MVSVQLTSKGHFRPFPRVNYQFAFPPAMYESQELGTLGIVSIFILAILIDV